MITKEELNNEASAFAKAKAVEALMLRASQARALAGLLERYADRLMSPPKLEVPVADAVDVFHWAINEIENYIRNVNFAELARRTAELKD